MLFPKLDSTKHLIIVFTSLAFARADYYIDDQNTSIQYSPPIVTANSNSNLWWPIIPNYYLTDLNKSQMTFDYNRFYNQTITGASCNATKNCYIHIPFTGSGITVYGVLLPGFNSFAVSLDEETAPVPTVSQEPATSPPIYNVPLYDIQSLPMSSHTLNITVAPEQANYCWMAFDYAYVNQTKPSSSAAPSSSHTPSLKSRFVVGPIVGGVIAGLAVIAAIAFVVIYFRKKKRRIPPITLNEMLSRDAYKPEPQRSKAPLPVIVPTSSFNTTTPVSTLQPSPTHNSQLTSPSSGALSESGSPMSSLDHGNSRALAHSSLPPHVGNSSEQLTDDQVDFVHTLYMHNIPAPSIARVMGRMVRRQDVSTPGGISTSPHDGSLLPTMAPPSYVA